MPESLTISTPPSSSSSAKRQRSADGRETLGRFGANSDLSANAQQARLRDNIRIPAYLDKSRADRTAAFQDIEWKQRIRVSHGIQNHDSPYRIDKSDAVLVRNRYATVSPWIGSRVKLKTPIGGSDYVNASPIVLRSKNIGESGGAQPATPEQKYIATQGPKSGQSSHFWYMVHQETTGETGVVIMLTQLIEGMKEKCAQYYPADTKHPTMVLSRDEFEPTENQEDGRDPFLDAIDTGADDREVTLLSEQNTDSAVEADSGTSEQSSDMITLLSRYFDDAVGCEVRKLELKIENQPKIIMHYLYARWPDFGLPEADDRRALKELSRQTRAEAGSSPRIVHCSAGVGRTGTWIAMDFLLHELDEGRLLSTDKVSTEGEKSPAPSPVSKITETWGKSGPPRTQTPTQEDGENKFVDDLIYETVNSLREQRMMMVYNEIQYASLYDVVREAFFEKYAEKPDEVGIRAGNGLEQTKELHDPPSKVPRIVGTSEESEQQPGSDAETEIMEVDEGDADDPYKNKLAV